MSAFIVSDLHISAIVTSQHSTYNLPISYNYNGSSTYIAGIEQQLGQILLNENYVSANHRYGAHNEPHTFDLTFPSSPYTPIQIIKLCNSLIYQSCEHPTWKDSEAYAIITSIIDHAITVLPGYEEADWTI